MSLRTKLLVLSVILAVIPLGIAGRSMIRITRGELKSSANDNLITVASQVSQDIEDFYRYTWLAPLRLIKKAVENKDLRVNEKLSLLTEGMKSATDLVALQISVQGVESPLLVTQDEFSNKLKKASIDPAQVLKLTVSQIAMLPKEDEIFSGDLAYLAEVDAWLVTLILSLDKRTFGRPATLSARINLDSLKKRIESHPFAKAGSITLIDPAGRKIFDQDRIDLSKGKLIQTAKKMLASNARTVGAEPYIRPSGEKMLGAYAFPNILDFGVIVEKNEADAYLAVTQMEWNFMVWIIIGFLVAVVGAIVVSISLTRPLLRLTRAARKISEGNLSIHIESKGHKDEIGQLSIAFNKMVDDLRHYIDELTETTKAKERAESELELANKIQQGFLPKKFPELGEIEVWGKCDPAREVGGDYFDFFQVDDDNYGMVIGDVSGKGVPAALFMAVSRTLFRIISSQKHSPDRVLIEFNKRLVALDQGANMFITVFYGVFNTITGRLLYSSAGHNMPYLKSSPDRGEKFRILPRMKTMVAGMMDGIPIQLAETKMRTGDAIVLYTDGMTEAINEKDEMFGEKRLEELLNEYSTLPALDMCKRLFEDVHAFHAGKPQLDDMTMFILKVK